jgi:hypothetical protein
MEVYVRAVGGWAAEAMVRGNLLVFLVSDDGH